MDCVSSIIVPKRTAPKITLWKSSGRQNPRSKPHPLVYTLFLFDRCIINYSKCFKDTQRCSQRSLPIAEKRIATKFKDLSIITLNKKLWREINDMGVFDRAFQLRSTACLLSLHISNNEQRLITYAGNCLKVSRRILISNFASPKYTYRLIHFPVVVYCYCLSFFKLYFGTKISFFCGK